MRPGASSVSSLVVSVGPTGPEQRVDVVDVLRGFALIGILWMNVEWFTRPVAELPRMDVTLGGVDHAVAWFVKIFVEGKFYRLFSLLFGMGFALMLTRAESQGRPFIGLFARRMGVLFVFGVLHLVLLWGGDILHRYAAGGLLLLGWVLLLRLPRIRRFDNDRFLLRLSLAALALPFVVGSVAGFGYGLLNDRSELDAAWRARLEIAVANGQRATGVASSDARPLAAEQHGGESTAAAAGAPATDDRASQETGRLAAGRTLHARRVAEETAALTQPDYWVAVTYRAKDALRQLAETPGFVFFPLFPIFLFGFWLVRSGVIGDAARHRNLFRLVAWGGVTVGFGVNVAAYTLMGHPATKLIDSFAILGFLLAQLGQYLLAAGYVGVIVLAMLQPYWRSRLMWLAPVGRMALTNYLMHSVVLGTIFYGYGFGFFGHVSRTQQVVLVIAIAAAQVMFSRYWLGRFRYGPMEWLWRNITYWRWQPLRTA